MGTTSTDRIEKQIQINAPLTRVWHALTDHKEFSAWFGVDLQMPFAVGNPTRGRITHRGYEHVVMQVVAQTIQPQRYFSFTWHPYAVDPRIDYTAEPPTLVEFRLEPAAGGTLLRVTESGFDSIPAARRDEAFRMNENGWAAQLQRIDRYATRA
ncbi:MAG TPA: SRPBCC family protein [Phycisphaerales bacterium]|nr:SRPBCC family protein [Phycisphaerales bacterium]